MEMGDACFSGFALNWREMAWISSYRPQSLGRIPPNRIDHDQTCAAQVTRVERSVVVW